MKKRSISLLLALLMVLSLLPFGVFADGPTKNGSAAFEILERAAKTYGTLNGATYNFVYSTTVENSATIEYSISYNSQFDRVTIDYRRYNGIAFSYSAHVSIHRELSMPYSAGYTGSDSNTDGIESIVFRVDSSFNSASYLSLQAIGNADTSVVVNRRIVGLLVKALTGAQEQFFDGTAYSVGDLGFTAFADENGWSYSAESAPTPTPDDTPKATGRAGEAYNYLKQLVIRNGKDIYGDGEYSYNLYYDEDSNVSVQLEYYSDKDRLSLFLSELNFPIMDDSELRIPASVSMPYDANQSYQTLTSEQQKFAWTKVDSSFSSSSDLTLERMNGIEESELTAFKGLFRVSLKTMLLFLQTKGFEGSSYTIADLGFTAFAEELRDAGVISDPTPTPTPKPTPTPTPKPTPTPTPKPTPSPTSPPKPTNPFVDVAPGDYYYTPVQWAVNHNPQITNGTGANTFSPEATCTRDQIVTFLWRAMGCPEPTNRQNPFVDVQPGDYFYKPVLWAVEKGITNGMDATHFGPTVPCSRAHVVTFLWRAYGRPSAAGNNPFWDVPAGQYYTDAVLWAVSKNITNGIDATHFGPDNPCQRGQIVTFLYRAKDITPVSEPAETPAPTPIVTENKVFSYIKGKIMRHGTRSDSGAYEMVFFSDRTDYQVNYIARYDPNTDTIDFINSVLVESSQHPTMKLITEFEVTPELKMPYLSKCSCYASDSIIAYAEADFDESTILMEGDLNYNMGFGPYTDESFSDYYADSLIYLLDGIDNNLLKGSGYTIVDLGFSDIW